MHERLLLAMQRHSKKSDSSQKWICLTIWPLVQYKLLKISFSDLYIPSTVANNYEYIRTTFSYFSRFCISVRNFSVIQPNSKNLSPPSRSLFRRLFVSIQIVFLSRILSSLPRRKSGNSRQPRILEYIELIELIHDLHLGRLRNISLGISIFKSWRHLSQFRLLRKLSRAKSSLHRASSSICPHLQVARQHNSQRHSQIHSLLRTSRQKIDFRSLSKIRSEWVISE